MVNYITFDEFIKSEKITSLEWQFAHIWMIESPDTAPDPVCQYHYAPPRKFTADFAWPGSPTILVECEGGVTNHRAHGSIGGIIRDIERANHAAANGCLVFRCWRGMLDDAEKARAFVGMIVEALRRR